MRSSFEPPATNFETTCPPSTSSPETPRRASAFSVVTSPSKSLARSRPSTHPITLSSRPPSSSAAEDAFELKRARARRNASSIAGIGIIRGPHASTTHRPLGLARAPSPPSASPSVRTASSRPDVFLFLLVVELCRQIAQDDLVERLVTDEVIPEHGVPTERSRLAEDRGWPGDSIARGR